MFAIYTVSLSNGNIVSKDNVLNAVSLPILPKWF
jgi:hypothetical protein